MGGNGTWLIASRNPQEFAAAAPVFGGWDYRINVERLRLHESAGHAAHGALHPRGACLVRRRGRPAATCRCTCCRATWTPRYPSSSRATACNCCSAWGYDVRYREIPGRGHEDLKARDEIADWLLEHRRDSATARGAAALLRSRRRARALAARHRLGESARDDRGARDVLDPQHHAASIRRMSPAWQSRRRRATWRSATVIWNGRSVVGAFKTGGEIRLAARRFRTTGDDKSPAREGRLTYFFNTPFAIVVGTSSNDAAMTHG